MKYQLLEFLLKFNEEIDETIPENVTLKDGTVKVIDTVYIRKDAQEFFNGLENFFKRCHSHNQEYWQSEVPKLGSSDWQGGFEFSTKSNETPRVIFNESSKPLRIEKGNIDKYKQLAHLAFDLYATIRGVNPDRIITLVNGAAGLNSIVSSMGFDSDNFLAVHRNPDRDYGRKLPATPVYVGKDISPGSKVLLLEDTSDLSDSRTYWEARKWLNLRGVSDDSPVFFKQIGDLFPPYYPSTKNMTADDYIKVQEGIYLDNGFNSFSLESPTRDPKFLNGARNRIAEIADNNPQMYKDFFKMIRNFKK